MAETTTTSTVWSANEWDPLEEVIVGRIDNAHVPSPDLSLFALEYVDLGSIEAIPTGPHHPDVIARTADELEAMCAEFDKLGIVVRRPVPRDNSATISTADWSTTEYHDYCPRDGVLVVGNTLIETPMALRCRQLEPFAYKQLFLEYHLNGAKWISAPKPRLADDMYDASAAAGTRLRNFEPVFDAANILRLNDDLLYLISDSGNELGARWLQSTLGPDYRVHACRGIYASTHVDSTIVPLREGLVLLNPERVTEETMPPPLRSWDKIWCTELVDMGFHGTRPYSSIWLGMNLLMINPELAVIDRRQTGLIEQLRHHGIDVLPLQLTHSRTLGGGFHCTTLDIRRAAR